jgi:hypothetical protein
MTTNEEENGALNKELLLVEVSELVYKELQSEGWELGEREGELVGCAMRHVYERLLTRGLLNDLGVKQIKLEQKFAAEYNDQEHSHNQH